MKIKNLLMKGLVLVAATMALAGCGEEKPTHPYVGKYTETVKIGFKTTIFEAEIGNNYFEETANGETEREEFSSIAVEKGKFKMKYLVLTRENGQSEKWLIKDSNTIVKKDHGQVTVTLTRIK